MDVAGNNELGVLGIFLAIAVALYVVSWTIAGPPGTIRLAATENVLSEQEPAAADRARP
jgi:hypothetical protein